MHEEIWLKANKKKYSGWKSISVSKSLGSICGTFQCTYAERYEQKAMIGGYAKVPIWDLYLGDSIEICIGTKTVMKGFAEQFANNFGPTSHPISVQGRSLLSELVDCSKEFGVNEFFNINILEMCEHLMWIWENEDPRLWVGTSFRLPDHFWDPFDKITIQQGDTLFSTISKMCKQRGVIPISYGDGILILSTAGDTTSKDALISGTSSQAKWKDIGHTILSGSINESNVDRFRQYVVKGQMSGHDPAGTSEGIDAITGPSGEAWDYGMKRVKPTVIMMDDPGDYKACRQRAKWESMNRAGRSRKYSYTIQGWTQRNGDPWQVNMLVPVKDEIGGVYGTYLIDSLKHIHSEKTGSKTTLSLVHPDTYEMPTATKKPENIKGTYDPLTPEPGGS